MFTSSFLSSLSSAEGLRLISRGGGLIISSSFLLDDRVKLSSSGIVRVGEFEEGTAKLVWLSLFLRGGFMFLEDVKIGRSSVGSALD